MARSPSSLVSIARRGSADGDTDRSVVWVRGEHDIATTVSLEAAIGRASARDDADVFVDLSGVTFMDASTVGAIVGSANRLRARSHALAVRGPSPPALRILELLGLAHLVQPASVGAAHPVGVAAALSTWVDVPPSDPGPSHDRSDATPQRRDVCQPAHAMLAMPDAEAQRSDP